jgi:glyoxylate reductase
MAKIFVTRQIPGDHLEKLKVNGNDVSISNVLRPLTYDELQEKSKGVDALLSLLTDKIDAPLMDSIGPQLKIISNYAVGFDNIDVKAASERGILITNTPSDEVDEAVAEHTWALISNLAKRVVEADEATRHGAYRGWEPDMFLGTSLIGKTLGIIGLGGIGKVVARLAVSYNMNVLYFKHSRDAESEEKLGVKYCNIDTLLTESDVVTLHLPLNDETRHMLDKHAFSKMKKSAFLINTARGPIINERDLIDALRSATIAGAGLDVFENDPNISPELYDMPNVITTPHIASATVEARNKMGEQAVTSILDTLAGIKPQNLVDEKVWETRRK